MNRIYLILLLLFLARIPVLSQEPSNTDDKYKYEITMRRLDLKEYKTYDTIVPLSYLLEPTQYESMLRFEYFQNFSYSPIDIEKTDKHLLCLSNDSIRITLTTRSFNREQLMELLSEDKEYFKHNPSWGVNAVNLDRDPNHFPHNTLNEIIVEVNGFEFPLNKKYYEYFFDVNIHCDRVNCGTSAYVTDDSRIIIQMNNSAGAGFYYAIFIFNDKGEIEEWVIQNVI